MKRRYAVTLAMLWLASVSASAQDGPRGWQDDAGPRVSRSEAKEERRQERGERHAERNSGSVPSRSDVEVRTRDNDGGSSRSARSEPQVFERSDWPRNESNRSNNSPTYVHGLPGDDGRSRSGDRDRSDNYRGRNYGDSRSNRDWDNRRYDNRRDNHSYRGSDRDWDRGRSRDYDRHRGHRDWSRRGWDRSYWRSSWNHGWRGTRYRAPTRYYYPRGYARFTWNIGVRIPAAYYASNYYVDYRTYGLATPPYGCAWIRIESDLLLIDLDSGEVLDALYGFYY